MFPLLYGSGSAVNCVPQALNKCFRIRIWNCRSAASRAAPKRTSSSRTLNFCLQPHIGRREFLALCEAIRPGIPSLDFFASILVLLDFLDLELLMMW